jgi:hypothetical protein
MMEAASTSETSVNFYQTTRRNNSEDSHLHPLQVMNQLHYTLKGGFLYGLDYWAKNGRTNEKN